MATVDPLERQMWRDAVLEAIRQYTSAHQTRTVQRRRLRDEYMQSMLAATQSEGLTPQQTLSRVLQELRDEGMLLFVDGNGTYLFVEQQVDVEDLDLPDATLYEGIRKGRLRIGHVDIREDLATQRQRKGQDQLRRVVLDLYDHQCAVCDIRTDDLLVASHIARWADYPPGRGDPSNVVCLCRFHDALFELGYFVLSDDLQVVQRSSGRSITLDAVLRQTGEFRKPRAHPPSPEYVAMHRARSTSTSAGAPLAKP